MVLLLSGPALASGTTPAADETMVAPDSFASMAALHRSWKIGYPWGNDHNGTARMEAERLSVRNGVLTIQAVRLPVEATRSSKPPHLPIRYASAAVHARAAVTVDACFPEWDLEGEFRVPVVKGSWPAFWLTPVQGWPPEGDIVEFKGDARNWFNTFRTPTDVSTHRVNIADASRWHRYRAVLRRIDDRDAEVTYFLNGSKVVSHRGPFTGRPLHVIINLQMEGASGMPGPKQADFQARHVRITRRHAAPYRGTGRWRPGPAGICR